MVATRSRSYPPLVAVRAIVSPALVPMLRSTPGCRAHNVTRWQSQCKQCQQRSIAAGNHPTRDVRTSFHAGYFTKIRAWIDTNTCRSVLVSVHSSALEPPCHVPSSERHTFPLAYSCPRRTRDRTGKNVCGAANSLEERAVAYIGIKSHRSTSCRGEHDFGRGGWVIAWAVHIE